MHKNYNIVDIGICQTDSSGYVYYCWLGLLLARSDLEFVNSTYCYFMFTNQPFCEATVVQN